MRTMTSLLVCMAALLSSPRAFVATEYRMLQGDCSNGNRWWAVSEYQNGRLMAIHGLDCSGKEYHKTGYRIVQSDPTGGAIPTVTGIADNGAAWYAVLRVDESGAVVWQGGRDADGVYWVWEEASAGSDPGPGENLD